jgi:predicted DCC family thiol-disulfide oxidoreductase YuxK
VATAQKTLMGRIIVFFDGYCHLCSGVVRWLLARDKRQRFLFAPVQGSTAVELLGLNAEQQAAPASLLVWHQGRVRKESDAALYLARQLPGFWKLLIVLYVVPSAVRNWVYRCIAARRYRWFGKSAHCMLPESGQEHRFLP